METTLDLTNARAFNNSLKKAVLAATNEKVTVEIINSYKFPNCWVRIHSEKEFSNEFRLAVFDACGFNRASLLNADDVYYGNIGGRAISAVVSQWVKIF